MGVKRSFVISSTVKGERDLSDRTQKRRKLGNGIYGIRNGVEVVSCGLFTN